MKHSWFVPLTNEQFEKLKAGLMSYFRFQLRLAIETVTYEKKNNSLYVYIGDGCPKGTIDRISIYINGFSQAIN